jgi:hypothetical protein
MPGFGLAMDIAILVLLAATVFIAFRLNANLRNFRESRSEMEGLVNRLTANIDRAEKAVGALQAASRERGADLDKKVKEARFLGDELKFMNEAGNALAERLEKLAEKNRDLVEKLESASARPSLPLQSNIKVKSIPVNDIPDFSAPADNGFSIRDRDMEDGEDEFDFLLDEALDTLQSQAERELYAMFQERKRTGRG